ncbi:MAG: SAF domain-containing protein [Propionibacteriaceae bacterium]|jgi:Flp pilus assembly protein CpaB|nr:SAF domain-containing protein [Propionibacteriaceae bacterium]
MTSLTRVLRRITLYRRAMAVIATMACVFCLAAAASGKGGPTTTVVTAAHRIAPGTTITADDLVEIEAPSDLVPDNALTSGAEAIGRIATSGAGSGVILTRDDILGDDSAAITPGAVVVPIRIANDDIISLIRPGGTIRLFLTDPLTGEITGVPGIRVVTIPQPAASGSGLMGGSTSSPDTVLIEAPEALAAQIATAAAGSTMTVAIE